MKKLLVGALCMLMLFGCGKKEEPVTAQDQSLELTSLANARELGGYRTQSGTTVKKGLLLRSAALAEVSEEEKAHLINDRNLYAIVDLRASFEVAEEPDPVFEGVKQVNLQIMDEQKMVERVGENVDKLRDPDVELAERMLFLLESEIISDQMYVEYLSTRQGKDGYREFFRILLETPEGSSVLWHCTNGKDRTGVAAMLLLGVLNVDEETILADYMLTNLFLAEEIEPMRKALEPHIQDKELLEELLVAGRGVYAPYMRNAMDYIKDNYGDIPGYVKAELGLSDADIAKLQQLYTE